MNASASKWRWLLPQKVKRSNLERRLWAYGFLLIILTLFMMALVLWPWGEGGLSVGKPTRAEADMKTFSTQLKTYEMTMLRAPGQAEGLKALVERPSSGPNLKRWRQLMTEIPRDPWGKEYVYRYPARKSAEDYDLISADRTERSGLRTTLAIGE